MKQIYIILILAITLSLLVPVNVTGQSEIRVVGQVFDNETKLTIPHLMIVNKRSNTGFFTDNKGFFDIKLKQTDTLILSSLGYLVKNICFKDSLYQPQYTITINMNKLYYTLTEVVVYPVRNLSQIEKDIEQLGVKPSTSLNGLEAIQSPITYLYERFSRFGKSKQKVAAWENEDLKRDLLQELFRLYIQYDIIDLSDMEFDAFIKYLNFSDEFIKGASQLELVMAIKGKYESFKYRWK